LVSIFKEQKGNSRQEFILRLFLSIMIVGLSSLQSFAEPGQIYPDSSDMIFFWQISNDTITVDIENLSAEPIVSFFLSDFTDSAAIFIECLVDGFRKSQLPTEQEYGSVYPDKYTNRWIVGDFSQRLILKYYSPNHNGCLMRWSAGHPYPLFGTIRGIGPPVNLSWHQ